MNETEGKKKGRVPRILKWIGWILAAPILLFVLLTTLLYIPYVQDFAVRPVVAYAESESGYNIELQRLRISFPLDLDLQGLVATDSEGDTIVATKSLVVDLDMGRVLKQHVRVDAVELQEARLNSKDIIASMELRGSLQRLYIRADDIDLNTSHVSINDAQLHTADVAIALRDTIIEEEEGEWEGEPTAWVIDIGRLQVDDTRVSFASVGDSLQLLAAISSAHIDNGHIDLGRSIYEVADARLAADTLHFVLLAADSSLTAVPLPRFSIGMSDVTFKQSPLQVDVEKLAFATASSHIEGSLYADLPSLYFDAGDAVRIKLTTTLSRADLLGIASSFLPPQLGMAYPDETLSVGLTLQGNLKKMRLSQLTASLPGSIDLAVSGELHDFLDSLGRTAAICFQLSTSNIE